MSEHKHLWGDPFTDFNDVIRLRCDCGADVPWYDAQDELEQQLAQVQEHSDLLARQIAQHVEKRAEAEQRLAEARALLEEVAAIRFRDPDVCICWQDDSIDWIEGGKKHKPECLQGRVQAFLAR